MNQDFELLSKQLEELLVHTLGTKHLINPYFRISKGTPEQTRKYLPLNLGIPRPFILAWNLFLIPINILKLCSSLILSAVFFSQNNKFKQKIECTRVLFLSHGTKRNLMRTRGDSFFDFLPDNISNIKNINCSILYTNQNLFGFKKNNNLLTKKNEDVKHILLPKFLPLRENLKYAIVVSCFAAKTLFLGLRCYFDEPERSKILLFSISSYFSRSTYTNYLLLNRIQESMLKNSITDIFLTFEGHSFEQLIIDEVLNSDKHINFYLYQHSPIVPLHYGITSFLNNCKSGITVLTTGTFYADYFRLISNVPKYIVFGTNKSVLRRVEKDVINIKTVVYAPDGTNFATQEFIKLIKNIINDSMDYIHILRLHPDYKLSFKLRQKLWSLNNHKNFMISNSNLHLDLSRANFLVYRSSAVGIESLNYDLIPIFYADPRHYGLNVLFANKAAYCIVRNSTDAIDLLKSTQNKMADSDKISLLDSYFSAIDYKKLNDTIKTI